VGVKVTLAGSGKEGVDKQILKMSFAKKEHRFLSSGFYLK